jgi:26S proteasome regulatory subunit T2
MKKFFQRNENFFKKSSLDKKIFEIDNSKKKKNFAINEQKGFFLQIYNFFLNKIEVFNDHSLRESLEEIQGSPITIGILEEKLGDNKAIISTNNGFEFYVEICSFVKLSNLKNGDQVLLNGKTFSIIGSMKDYTNHLVNLMKVNLVPNENFASIGGLRKQIMEIKEVIELPINNPDIFSNIGIIPPKGVILYGEPGTGKTLLAKAVANETKATFFRIGGSELVQKFLGDGPKLVREIFHSASLHTPSIIFMDEIDAIGTTRFDSFSGGEREIQRTMLELLNQLDGFDPRDDVKIIMATNRIDSLDPALIRPGRIDRKIEFPYPGEKTILEIFKIHTKKMKIDKKFKIENLLTERECFSGADIKAICTESALLALRDHRLNVEQEDIKNAKNNILKKKKEKFEGVLYN